MTKAMETAKKIVTSAIGRYGLEREATAHERVLAFHDAYGAPIRTKIVDLSVLDRERRLRLILEEFLELVEASGFSIVAEAPGMPRLDFAAHHAALKVKHVEGSIQDPVEMMDALGDIEFVTHGFAIELGGNLEAVGREIYASNMTKLDSDGKPIVNEPIQCRVCDGTGGGYSDPVECSTCDGAGFVLRDPSSPRGKILKGPNYVKPDIAAVMEWK